MKLKKQKEGITSDRSKIKKLENRKRVKEQIH